MGTVLLAGGQTLSVTFTPSDTTDYTAATGSVSIDVTPATPTITWSNPANISTGTALGSTQLDATATLGGTAVQRGTLPTILPLEWSFRWAITRRFPWCSHPSDTNDYNSATGSVSINVDTATTPTIKWSVPANISYGTALTGTQLDATASVSRELCL